MQHLRKNDQVIVIAGKDKGIVGKILKLDWKKNLVWVEKVRMIKKHVKPSSSNAEGNIEEKEGPINISNVSLFITEKKKNIPTKVKFVQEGKIKKRIAKKNGKEI
ncbi:MAG: 50S ribosomal protein L24 [Mycoplasma sp.]|nr:50S ribosomal protein L24 [Mycoplasma sp.]